MDTPKTRKATATKKYQKASTVCCSANVLLFLAYQCAFFGRIFFYENLARIFASGSQNLQKFPGIFLALFEASRSLSSCPACLLILFHSGDIQVLEKCTQLTKVNFYECRRITGACCLEERSFSRLRPSPHLVPRIFLGGILRIFSRVADICTTNKRK